jgi:hypothetical protein
MKRTSMWAMTLAVLLRFVVPGAAAQCCGDCDGNGQAIALLGDLSRTSPTTQLFSDHSLPLPELALPTSRGAEHERAPGRGLTHSSNRHLRFQPQRGCET